MVTTDAVRVEAQAVAAQDAARVVASLLEQMAPR